MSAKAAIPIPRDLDALAASIVLPDSQLAEISDRLAEARKGSRMMTLRALNRGRSTAVLALEQAQSLGVLDELLMQLMHAGAFPTLDRKGAMANRVRVKLEAAIESRLGALGALDLCNGIIVAKRRICHIVVVSRDGRKNYGTGFLVGPQTVLTAWHVVSPLLSDNRTPAESAKDLSVHFDLLEYYGNSCETVAVAEDWLGDHSECHVLERDQKPFDPESVNDEEFAEKLDYAAIRLSRPVGHQRGYYRLNAHRLPTCSANVAEPLTLIQHPGGARMAVTQGAGLGIWPPRSMTRLRHTANSASAASGGLLLDNGFEPVAMHQCAMFGTDGSQVNGAVLTARIIERSKSFDDVVGRAPVHRTEDGLPVIGREQLQRHLSDMALGNKRMLLVRGERNSGKSFSANVMRTYLGLSEHTVVVIEAETLSVMPEVLARALLQRIYGSPVADGAIPSHNGETTQEAWIRDCLYPVMAEHLLKAAGSRILWLVIDKLDINPIANSGGLSLLEHLYSNLDLLPCLRVVLIGQRESQVAAARPGVVAVERVGPVSQSDIRSYIQRRFLEAAMPARLDHAETLSQLIYSIYINDYEGDIHRLSRLIQEHFEPMLEKKS